MTHNTCGNCNAIVMVQRRVLRVFLLVRPMRAVSVNPERGRDPTKWGVRAGTTTAVSWGLDGELHAGEVLRDGP